MTIIRSVVVIIVVLLGVAAPAAAQSVTPSFQFWSHKADTGVEYNFYAERPMGASKKFGLMAWGQKDPSWGQIYAGPTWNTTSWSSVSFAVGAEQDEHPWRIAGSVWVGGRGNTSLLILETGGSGFWYKYTYTRVVTPNVSLGLFSQRYFGTGPLIRVGIGKTKFTVWSAPVTYDTETGSVKNMSGISYKF